MLLLKLALRNILRQRRRSILTAISMAGGYVLCAWSFSMVDGSYTNVIEIFTGDETGHVQIHAGDYLRRPKIHLTIDDPARVADLLDRDPEVTSGAPRVYAPALSYAGENHSPVQVVGIDPVAEANTSRLADKVDTGRWLTASIDEDGLAEALIGHGVATNLDISVGGEIILISEGADGSIANDLFRVVGIVGSRRSAERSKVYLPLGAAQSFLSLGNRIHEVAIMTRDIGNSREVAARLDAALPALNAVPWQVARETFYNSMQADRRGNAFTLGVVLFIVFIGVLNTVLMSVLERTREFGVLKAIGSRPTLIMGLIMLETSMLALGSLAIGVVIALPAILWFSTYGIALPEPVDMGGIEFGFITGDLTFSVLATPMLIIFVYAIAVSILPGIRAARVLPTEAMRTF